MNTHDRPKALKVVVWAAQAVESVRAAEMLPSHWASIETFMHRMQAALDRDDLDDVMYLRQQIEEFEHRQAAVAVLSPEDRVEQPERLRTISDNLTRRLEALRIAMDAQDAERPR